MTKLTGKVAVVTGAARGLGFVVVQTLAAAGAKVIATDIDKAILSVFADAQDILPIVQDVSKEDDWQMVMKSAVDKFGKVNIVVNNAAIRCEKGIMECTLAEWNQVLAINATGTFLGMQYGAREMIKIGGGSIVNISSIGGMVSGDADGADVAYSASKGAIRTMTKHGAIYLAAKNIRVNSIHPGGIMTDMLKGVFDTTPSLWDRVKETSPLPPHINAPQDIANGVLFLTSDESRTITGVELPIDCGYMAK